MTGNPAIVSAERIRGDLMDHDHARAQLNEEKRQLQGLLSETTGDAQDERSTSGDQGDWSDPQVSLNLEEVDDAVTEGLSERLAAVERALARLDAGTYGRSTKSGEEIPEARLEADPAAELTADEALEE
jgi:DnaK suppressor protein